MELLMIYKISPHPSLLKRGRKKVDMTHSITRRAIKGLLKIIITPLGFQFWDGLGNG